MGELEKRVGPLKRDSEKAQQFLELSEKRKSLEITLWVDAIRRANDTLRDQQRKYEAAEADYDRLSRQLDAFDEKNADLREETQQLMLKVEQANADIRAITEANAGSESEIAVLKTRASTAGSASTRQIPSWNARARAGKALTARPPTTAPPSTL